MRPPRIFAGSADQSSLRPVHCSYELRIKVVQIFHTDGPRMHPQVANLLSRLCRTSLSAFTARLAEDARSLTATKVTNA